ncbi:MAG: fumarylacetoacetate hydrolase family protein [Cohaesibacter sp.]|nr:fumarylacetoacetate hydrolase family protein [Cohaesibacter sp.]
MKFATAIIDNKPTPIFRSATGSVHLLSEAAKNLEIPPPDQLIDLITNAPNHGDLCAKLEAITSNLKSLNEDEITWAPPLKTPSKILGVAFNNKELMKKAHRDPGVPNFFLKPPSCLQAHNKPIIVDPDWGAVIPEPELCAVIGKRAKHIEVNEALDHVFGYLIHNDVTSHGLKFQKDSIAVTYDQDMARPEFYTWRNLNGPEDTDAYYVYHTRSKGTDTFGPMGPWITTANEIDNPNDLSVEGKLNEEIFTRDHTGNYRFSIEECIAEASRYFTLEPGDLISFGTTGKGAGRFPRGHKSLLIGEEQGTISISIEPLGTLSNPIQHQKGGA